MSSTNHIRDLPRSLLSSVSSVMSTVKEMGELVSKPEEIQEDKDTKKEIYVVESEDFGDGSILSINETKMEVMFDHGIEIVELNLLDEDSIELVQSLIEDVKESELIPESTSKAKEKLQKIVNKEHEQHVSKMNKHRDTLHKKFHSEASGILKKHGYSKVSDGSSHHTWVKPHDDGHITSVSISKDRGHFGTDYNITNSKNTRSGTYSSHSGVYRDKHAEEAHKNMIPKFEGNLIDFHEKHKSGW